MHETVDLGVEGLSPAVYVGAGGSANVFAARLLETGEQVAVKLLRASADSTKERERFEREHETIARLSTHDGIVPVVDAGVTDRNEPYFLMPLMEGSLQDRIDTEGALEWETATQLVAEVADTLEFAHANKILHRDLKPGNILLDTDGVPRVSDFGIAKLMDSSVSKSSKALGTPSFMPPERFKAVDATEASDVYGLGATLAALLTGTAPFLTGQNDTDAAVMMRVMNDEPPPLTAAGIPEPIADVVTRSMAKDPLDRPASAGEFAHLLRTATLDAGGEATAGPVTVAIPRRDLTIPELTATDVVDDGEDDKSKRPVWIMMAAAAVFVAILGMGGALALSNDDTPVDVEVAGSSETTAPPSDELNEGSGANDDGGAKNDSEGTADELNGDDADDALSDESTSPGTPIDGDTTLNNGNDQDGAGDEGEGEGAGDTNDTALSEEPTNTGNGGGATATTTPTTEAPTNEDTSPGGVVEEPPPPDKATACFTPSTTSVQVGAHVSFTNCSTDATSYAWNFGDGTTSTLSSPSKSWTTAGTKMVRLTASGDGGSGSATRSITVNPAPVPAPHASFTVSAATIAQGGTVTFTSNSTGDITSTSWEFGDGGTGTGTPAWHTYNSHGSYTAKLTVTGPGGSHTATRTITVQPPHAAGPDAENRYVTLASDENSTSSDLTVFPAVNARVLNDSTGGSYSYTLTWAGIFSHTRQSDNAYDFWIDYEVLDADGNSGSSGRIFVNVEAKTATAPEDRSRTITMTGAQNQIDVNLLGAGGNSARWLGGDDKHALYGTGQYLYAREDAGASTHSFQFYELLNQVIIVRWSITVNVQAQN